MTLPAVAFAAFLAGAAPAPAAPAAGPSAALSAAVDELWEYRLRENPLMATGIGDHRYDARMPSVGPADRARQKTFLEAMEARLRGLDRGALSAEETVTYDMARRDVEDELAELRFGLHRMPLTAEAGFHSYLTRLAAQMPMRTVADYENYIARLRGFRAYFDQQMANLREGIQGGFTQPRVVLDGFDTTITPHVVDDPAESVFDAPFRSFPAGVSAGEQDRLRREGRAAIRDSVLPAFRDWLRFFREEYLPATRSTIAAADLPEGRALYAQLVRHHTTLDVTPDEVHRIGLREVANIRAEMHAVMKATGFTGDFAAFLQFLRTDPRFYAKTPEELLREAAFLAKKIDARLPALFGRLPRQPYGVEPVPADIAPRYTSGRYVPAPLSGTRAGTYWVNTHALDSRPLYNLEALTLHEAVPGHHLQYALRQELSDLPPLRRYASVNAYSEGWGLYSERLGLEAGFYTDPYSNFGRLTYEMWRACRLVVDTGMHWLGWSREKAREYLASQTALPLHEVDTEIDRYISWPGQALAYKMGELKIRELRTFATEALGPDFDVRAFHDTVLATGPVPLTVLEDRVRAWVAERQRPSAGSPRPGGTPPPRTR